MAGVSNYPGCCRGLSLKDSLLTASHVHGNVQKMLEHAVTCDPSYELSYLSLAALYLNLPLIHSHYGRDMPAAFAFYDDF